MAETRDSGVHFDNENDSLSTSSSCRDFNQLSYVQRLRKRFECLAKEQEKEFHSECNWWLEDENESDENSIVANEDEPVKTSGDVLNKVLLRNVSTDSEKKSYSKQSSVKSQISHDSGKITITPATPVITPSSPKEFVTLIDYQQNNETNDSDSFDSDEETENEKSEEVEEELPAEYIRNSRQSLKLMRPISITSQTSK
jgi:hypothetical protein